MMRRADWGGRGWRARGCFAGAAGLRDAEMSGEDGVKRREFSRSSEVQELSACRAIRFATGSLAGREDGHVLNGLTIGTVQWSGNPPHYSRIIGQS